MLSSVFNVSIKIHTDGLREPSKNSRDMLGYRLRTDHLHVMSLNKR